MAGDTGRDHERPGLDQYWRRRIMVFGGLFGTIGLVVWACSAGGGEETSQPVPNAAAAATPAPVMPTAMPTVTVTATAKVTAEPQKRDGDACDPADVVIDMAMTREVYGRGEKPQFRYTVVNTGDRACTFDVGPRALDMRITSGSDRIWTRSACEGGDGNAIRMLRRGIPHVGVITWDRLRGTGGCRGERPRARPGTYIAKVKVGDLKVKKQVFALR
ncbi:hypothetical protein ACSNOI_15665 [Actinomadura kijaniata]|uniref:hypothetical protein n=1 Tax=Actinomadura kijaniata TaxID=46161 RepID=UPI003F1E2712